MRGDCFPHAQAKEIEANIMPCMPIWRTRGTDLSPPQEVSLENLRAAAGWDRTEQGQGTVMVGLCCNINIEIDKILRVS
jgi:hypothetical protein